MPTNNYFNPNAYRPTSQGMGMENAYDMQMDRQRYDEMAGLQKLLTAYDLAKSHEDLTKGYRQRQAERGAKTSGFQLDEALNRGSMDNPNYVPGMVRGKIGEAQTKEAKGREDIGTVESKIGAANAGNRVKSLEDKARQLEMMAAGGNLNVAGAYQRFYDGIPNEYKEFFPKQYTPEVPNILRQLSATATENAPHRRDMAKQGSINATQTGIASGHDTTNLEIARINAKSREDVAELRAKMTQARENFQQYLTNWARKEVTEGRMTIEQAAKAVEQMMINSKMAGAPEDPRALPREVLGNQPIAPTPQPRVPPPSAIPQQQQPRAQSGQSLSQQQVQQMGGLFDPRYDYAVGPDGKLKRKLKQ